LLKLASDKGKSKKVATNLSKFQKLTLFYNIYKFEQDPNFVCATSWTSVETGPYSRSLLLIWYLEEHQE